MKDIFKKIISIFSIVCYIGIGIYAIVSIPNIFGSKPIIVLTGSMEPTYKVGSIIYCKSIKNNDINVGDVITFNSNGTRITHRVTNVDGSIFTTKGDANNVEDSSKVLFNDIEGKVSNFSLPYFGYYIGYVNENNYLVLIAVLVIILDFVLSNFNIQIENSSKNKAFNIVKSGVYVDCEVI